MAASKSAGLAKSILRHAPAWTLGWGLPMSLHRLYTPFDRCVCVPLGPVRPDDIEQLTIKGYDQAPVVTPYGEGDEHLPGAGFPEGIVTTARLRGLLAAGKSLEREEPELAATTTIELDTTLGAVLDTFSSVHAALVIEEEVQGEGSFRTFHGLITISDLNRQPFRNMLYGLLAEVEAGLAGLVEARCQEPWEWLMKLPEDQQAILLGYWELSKRKGVDVSPVSGATLTQLLRAIGGLKTLRSELGFPSASKFSEATGALPTLRNNVMHPVRPIVLSTKGVGEIKENLEVVLSLSVKLAKLGFMDLPVTPEGILAIQLAAATGSDGGTN
jgi:hypothetical protein